MPETTPAPAPDDPEDPLARERAHLAHARRCLAAMREHARRLDALGGNEVSAEALAIALQARVASLADHPDSPLFFGRLDYAGLPDRPPERFHIGRRHVLDDAGDPVVVDWRAGISRAFYRATTADRMGVRLRRRFGFDGGALTAYEDEWLDDPTTAGPGESRLLREEIERPRVGPMRDIVATIQPDQDDIVRADLADTVVVQGGPGTGKTAVGLHRAAYLLYAHRERLRRSGVLVVGPNTAFLGYIEQVLPALGEVEADQRTVADLVAGVRIRGEDPAPVATLKGDPRLAEVLRRGLYAGVREPTESVVVPVGSRRWRVPVWWLAETVAALRERDARYAAARLMLARQVASYVVRLMEEDGDAPSDRVLDRLARSPAVRGFVDAHWPAVDPKALVFGLLSDRARLAAAAAGLLSDSEQALLLWSPAPARPGAARWSLADAVLIDEARDLIERTPSLGHVILDEAQDLSPMQCRAVGRRATTGSVTVLGDLAQATTPWATGSWADTLTHLGKPAGRIEVLERSYRVPAPVLAFAAALLPSAAPGVPAPVSVREGAGSLSLRRVSPRGLHEAAVAAAQESLLAPGSLGVIVADAAVARVSRAFAAAGLDHEVLGAEEPPARVALVPASLAKGLEFDSVVVVEPAAIAAAEAEERVGLRRLYVVLTRAVSRLTVVHAEELPAALWTTSAGVAAKSLTS